MEHKNDSVDEILKQLKGGRSSAEAASFSGDEVDDILNSLGLEPPKKAPARPQGQTQVLAPSAEELAPKAGPDRPAPAPREAGRAQQPPAPSPQEKKRAAAPAQDGTVEYIRPDRPAAPRAPLDDGGEFVRTSPDIFSGEKIDRLSHADELIDEEFYKFFTKSVVVDKAEIDRRMKEEKRRKKKEKKARRGLFSFLRAEEEEEEEEEDDGGELYGAQELPPEERPVPGDIFAAAPEQELPPIRRQQTPIPAAPAADEPPRPRAAAAQQEAPGAPEREEGPITEMPPAAPRPVQAPAPENEPRAAAADSAPAGTPAGETAPAEEFSPAGDLSEEEGGSATRVFDTVPELPVTPAGEDAEEEPAPRHSIFAGFGSEEGPDEEPEEEEEEEEIEDYDSPSDAPTVQADLKSLRTSLNLRLLVTAILGVITLYLSLSATFPSLPMIPAIAPAGQPLFYLIANIVLLLVAMVVNYNTIASGLSSIFSSPSPDLLPSLASVAALAQCAVFLTGAEKFGASNYTVFAGVAVLCLAGNTFGKCITARMVAENFEMASSGFDHAAAYQVTDEELVKKVTDGLGEPDPHLLVSRPTALVRGFLRQSFSEHRSDRLAKWLGLAGLAGGLACAVIAGVLTKEPFTAISCFAGAVCLAAPLSSTLVGAIPAGLMQASAARVGAVVPGPSAVEDLKNTNVVLVGARDLFPPSTVRLRGIKTFQKERIDLAILYAASILVEGCDTLRDIFLGVVEGKRDMLYPVENLVTEVGYGFLGWIDNNRVIVGSREMMTHHDVEIPSMDYEKRYTGEDKQPIYLAVAGRLFGMFLVSYGPDEDMAETVEELRHAGISLLVKSSDFNITSELVAGCYGVSPENVKVLSGAELTALTPSLSYLPESEGVMTHIGSFSSFIGGLRAAIAAAGAEKAAGIVQTAAVVLGILLGLLLSVTTGLGSLSALAVLLYQCAWLILVIAVPLMKRY
ncbi:hypothetical protein H8S23_04820 [Anaerofilum sp. BX8]|uniref:Copper exporting ATPase n=1 Tax=Anaerofilum hominis TaxID=2763016 RepID=A0A923L0N8_9FIRM|nr:hypothetical protein [Anaerofilum hominis]MBC5580820.1 hypothetical protein [Anaerofilum hominis]